MSHADQLEQNANAIQPSRSLTWWEIWQRLIVISGSYGPKLKRSMWLLIAAAVLQGGALACILPMFVAIFTLQDAQAVVLWLVVMTLLTLLSLVARWGSQGFDFGVIWRKILISYELA